MCNCRRQPRRWTCTSAQLLHGPAAFQIFVMCRILSPAKSMTETESLGAALPVGGQAALAGMRSKTGRQDLKAEGDDLWLCDVPGVVVDAVAGCVARLLVLNPAVERLTFVGPLLRAI